MNNWRIMWALVSRHMKLYFKDKQNFIISLISPMVLMLLYVTFLRNIYTSSLLSCIPEGFTISDSLVDSFTAGWLLSSILGVTAVSLAFCSNTIIIHDKIEGNIKDMLITPVRKLTISISYLIANYFVTFIICLICMVLGLVYIAVCGWYMTPSQVGMIVVNLLIMVAFGSLMSAIIENFVSSQGGLSAIVALVSSIYGFIYGAYMPISQFSGFIKNLITFLPGTYGTVLFRKYFMGGAIDEMAKTLPAPVIDAIRDGFDNNIYFYDNKVETSTMFLILFGAIAVLAVVFTIIIIFDNRKAEK